MIETLKWYHLIASLLRPHHFVHLIFFIFWPYRKLWIWTIVEHIQNYTLKLHIYNDVVQPMSLCNIRNVLRVVVPIEFGPGCNVYFAAPMFQCLEIRVRTYPSWILLIANHQATSHDASILHVLNHTQHLREHLSEVCCAMLLNEMWCDLWKPVTCRKRWNCKIKVINITSLMFFFIFYGLWTAVSFDTSITGDPSKKFWKERNSNFYVITQNVNFAPCDRFSQITSQIIGTLNWMLKLLVV